ncbi:hypothetical protein HYN48_01255 [Flavobacterium magnum]|uniref:Outer membrane protein beta-barrel domain-containing protein n=1 Tax=Flavobacterium magnum TaxID=2162713 RepID=A0A2S0RBA1_9FLAO|nr:hypothetical protein [Flavobacterium magnum]AWA28825.1 hypothetical protein HYN48_01255 [Flavobacterium magnum]
MKIITSVLLLCGFCALGQPTPGDHDFYKALQASAGYSYVGAQDGNQAYHFAEIGVNRARYGGRHGGGFEYGISTDVGLNTHKLVVGPKVEGIMYFQLLAVGAALGAYTDFDAFSPRLVPIFGLGGPKFRLTFNPHIKLRNKDVLPVPGLVNLTVNFTLDRKPMDK